MDTALYAFTRVGFRTFGCTGPTALIIAPHIYDLAYRSATA